MKLYRLEVEGHYIIYVLGDNVNDALEKYKADCEDLDIQTSEIIKVELISECIIK